MSIRCITVPPRMNPSGFASFGNTTCTISVALSDGRFGVSTILVPAIAIDERLQRAPEFGREILLADRVEERDGGLIGLQLRHALRAASQMPLQLVVHLLRQVALDE